MIPILLNYLDKDLSSVVTPLGVKIVEYDIFGSRYIIFYVKGVSF